jgi:hypothetical protein
MMSRRPFRDQPSRSVIGRHPITMMTAINVTARVTSRKSLALAGYVSAFYVHDGVAEQNMKTLTMLETKHWDSCPIYLLHLVSSQCCDDLTGPLHWQSLSWVFVRTKAQHRHWPRAGGYMGPERDLV